MGRQDPGDLFEREGHHFRFSNCRSKEADFEFFGSCRVLMAHAAKFRAFQQRYAEFFLQFPRECNLRRFTIVYFATGEFPLQGRSIAFAALADEQAPVAALNHSRDDRPHACSRIPFTRCNSL